MTWLVIAAVTASTACRRDASGSPAAGAAPTSAVDTLTGPRVTTTQLQADVYVDGTVSMAGFARGASRESSEYVRFLDDVQGAVTNAWATSEVRYFKFGTSVRALTRDEYAGAKNRAFYSEKGVSEATAIDAVLERAESSKFSIIVTDLFQTNGDLNAMTSALKERFIKKQTTIGILAIPSAFDGVVYDALVPAFPYKSTSEPASLRPFYALLLGSAADIQRLMQVFVGVGYIDPSLFVLVSPHIVQSSTVTVRKRTNLNEVGEQDGWWAFNVQKGEQPSSVEASVHLVTRPGVPPFEVRRLEIDARHSEPTGAAGGAADVVLETIDGTLEALTVRLGIRPGVRGEHRYDIALRLPSVNAFVTPAWVGTWTSPNPAPGRDPNKTFNLDKFITNLLQAAAAVQQPAIARVPLRIRHR